MQRIKLDLEAAIVVIIVAAFLAALVAAFCLGDK